MTMRIKGPTEGAPPIDGVGASEGAGAVGDVAPAAPSALQAATGTATAPAADAVSQVAARLRAGEIGPDQAVELLIEDAIARQVGQALEAGGALEQELRTLLQEYAAEDPFLAAKIRRLHSDQ